MSPARGIPTSRAYWELKAEQMLNRVFSGDMPIEVEIVEPAAVGTQVPIHPAQPLEQTHATRQRSAHAIAALLQRRPELVPISIAGAGLATALVTVDMENNVLTDHSTGKTYALKAIGDVSARCL